MSLTTIRHHVPKQHPGVVDSHPPHCSQATLVSAPRPPVPPPPPLGLTSDLTAASSGVASGSTPAAISSGSSRNAPRWRRAARRSSSVSEGVRAQMSE